MKVTMQVTVEVNPQTWAEEYGVILRDVPADVREWVKTAIYEAPVRPSRVTVKETR